MTKQFIRVNEVISSRSGEAVRPTIIGVMSVAMITELKAGGSRIELTNGNKITVSQTTDELFQVLPLENLYIGSVTEQVVEEDDEQTATTIDPADIAGIASASAIKLAEENGINISDVEPNRAGKIGKPEVEKFLAGLDELDGEAE